jgi:hypothetical protein
LSVRLGLCIRPCADVEIQRLFQAETNVDGSRRHRGALARQRQGRALIPAGLRLCPAPSPWLAAYLLLLAACGGLAIHLANGPWFATFSGYGLVLVLSLREWLRHARRNSADAVRYAQLQADGSWRVEWGDGRCQQSPALGPASRVYAGMIFLQFTEMPGASLLLVNGSISAEAMRQLRAYLLRQARHDDARRRSVPGSGRE